jgi:hypothetical protein
MKMYLTEQPRVHDLATLRQADALHNLVIIRQNGRFLLSVPEGGQKIEQVA